jgi:hypothetical protein
MAMVNDCSATLQNVAEVPAVIKEGEEEKPAADGFRFGFDNFNF